MINSERKFRVGDVVFYRRQVGIKSETQMGRVKQLCEHDDQHVFVVFNCNNDWNNYAEYTAQHTNINFLQ